MQRLVLALLILAVVGGIVAVFVAGLARNDPRQRRHGIGCGG